MVAVGAQVIGVKVAQDCLLALLAAEFSTEEQFRIGWSKSGNWSV
jgi:hypothetical protein